MKFIQVHRFYDRVAVYVGRGETVYLTPVEARKMAKALNAHAKSVETEEFRSASVRTFEMHVEGKV